MNELWVVHHIVAPVLDVDKAREFYGNIFELIEIKEESAIPALSMRKEEVSHGP